MRVLILTCHTGEGHNSTAAAIQEGFQAWGVPCDIVDSLGLISPTASALISSGHARLYRYAPKMFGTGYQYAENHPSVFDEGKLVYKYLASGAKRLYALVQKKGYDLIICAHVFPALMAAQLRRRYGLEIRTSFVATDYTCSPITGECDLDVYFIPHEGLADEFAAAGVPRERLVASGIPVRQAFWQRGDREESRKQFGLDRFTRHALLMCGSMGCGPMEELTVAIAGALPADAALTVICGTNERLYNNLCKHGRDNVLILGYTQVVPLLMDSADLFLTKPGGISISEAGAKRLPLLLIDAVGGCEDRNLAYFTGMGWAETAENPEGIARRCLTLLDDAAALDTMSGALARAFCENPVDRILSCLLPAEAELRKGEESEKEE